jgi:hypothetical protein
MRKTLAVASAALASFFAAPLALAAPPGTLTGETLLACSSGLTIPAAGGCNVGERKGSLTTNRSCPPADAATPGAGTFTFAASGVAAGPYPGTFTESGTVKLGDFDRAIGLQPVLEFTASFTIDSPAGRVQGTKQLALSGGGLCSPTLPFFSAIAFLTASYKATITTSAGKFRDEGTADTTVFDAVAGTAANPQELAGLGEAFASTLTETIPAFPTTKDECKDGGWESYGVFKNQGQCVSFVANGGKHAP